MITVECQSCKDKFEVPLASPGKIDYERCKNIFRVSYRFRTACPHCRKILQLTPQGQNHTVGVVLNINTDEETETILVDEREPTLAKEEAPPQMGEPLPTVKVTQPASQPAKQTPITEDSFEEKTDVRPFRFINENKKRPAPLHVDLRKKKKRKIFSKKFFLGSILALCGIVAFWCVSIALRPGQTLIPQESLHIPSPQTQDHNPHHIEPLAQGGPEETPEQWQPEVQEFESTTRFKSKNLKKNSLLKLPDLAKVTSGFGLRLDPFHKRLAFHGGVDFRALHGTKIRAALEGSVTFAGREGNYGKMIILKHQNGYETRYAHLSKLLVKNGAKVKKGDEIGLAGSTGRSTGAHVHFELLRNGKRIDPLRAKFLSRKT